jgi:hypothetical protein
MKNHSQQNSKKISGTFTLILGSMISSILLLLNYVNAFNLELEVVLAPFIVISLLAYGDKLLIFLFLNPICFASKLFNKVRDTPSQQQLT